MELAAAGLINQVMFSNIENCHVDFKIANTIPVFSSVR
jgi:hypothetical protein